MPNVESSYKGCFWSFIAFLFVAAVTVLMTLTSCTTTKEFEKDNHSYQQLTQKMDSMMHTSEVWQQEFIKQQSAVFESLKEMEKNDTSHTVTINEKGDTVKERIVIVREVEKDHSMEREAYNILISQYNRIDSLLKVAVDKQAEVDSVMKAKEKVIEKKPSIVDRIFSKWGVVSFFVVVILTGVYILRRKNYF